MNMKAYLVLRMGNRKAESMNSMKGTKQDSYLSVVAENFHTYEQATPCQECCTL